jgi:hypothetical protein
LVVFLSRAWCFFTWASSSLKAILQPARTFFPAPVACREPVGNDKFKVQKYGSLVGVHPKNDVQLPDPAHTPSEFV